MRRRLVGCVMRRSSMDVLRWPVLWAIACMRMASIGHGSFPHRFQTTHLLQAFQHRQSGMPHHSQVVCRSSSLLASLSSGPSQAMYSNRTARRTTCVEASQAISQHSRRSHTQCHSIFLIHLVLPKTLTRQQKPTNSTSRSTTVVWRCLASWVLSPRHECLVLCQHLPAKLSHTMGR